MKTNLHVCNFCQTNDLQCIYVHNYDNVWEYNYISEEGFYMYL